MDSLRHVTPAALPAASPGPAGRVGDLCHHWARRIRISFTTQTGLACRLQAAGPGHMHVIICCKAVVMFESTRAPLRTAARLAQGMAFSVEWPGDVVVTSAFHSLSFYFYGKLR